MSYDTSSFNAFIVSLVNEKDVYNCENCNQEYTTRKRIMRHIQVKHRNELNCWICKVCHAPYGNEATVRQHIRIRHKNIWKCEVCKESFNSEQVLKQHCQTHDATSTYSWRCKVCNIPYVSKKNLMQHIRDEHNKTKTLIWKCGLCSKQCTDKEDLRNHYYEKHGTENLNIWKCEVCKKYFNSEKVLKQHREKHEATTPLNWKCGLCSEQYTDKEDLRNHYHEKHGTENIIKSKCNVCYITFTDQKTYEMHIAEHYSEKQISCEENNHQLDPLEETNIKESKNQRPYCEGCDAEFEFGAVYIRHLSEKHNLQVQKFNFDTEADFIRWKYIQETKHVVRFELQAVRKDDAETLKLYICSRRGYPWRRKEMKRTRKTKASIHNAKMRCPAHMQVTISKDGVHCEYISEHWYHKCDDVNSATNENNRGAKLCKKNRASSLETEMPFSDDLGTLTDIGANVQISQIEDAHDDVDKSSTANTTTSIDFEVDEPVEYDPILHIKIEPNEQYLNEEPDVDSNECCVPFRCYSEQNKTSVNEIPIKNIDFEVDEPVQYDPVFDIKITESNERYLKEEPDINSNESCLPSRCYSEQNKTSVNEIPIQNPTINETDVVIKDDYNTEKVLDDDGNDATIVLLKNPENLSPATVSNSGTDDEIGTFFTTMCEMTRSLPLIEQLKIKTLLRNAVLDAQLTSV